MSHQFRKNLTHSLFKYYFYLLPCLSSPWMLTTATHLTFFFFNSIPYTIFCILLFFFILHSGYFLLTSLSAHWFKFVIKLIYKFLILISILFFGSRISIYFSIIFSSLMKSSILPFISLVTLRIARLKSVFDYFIIWISAYCLLFFSVFSKLLPKVDHGVHFCFSSSKKLTKTMLSSSVSHPSLLNNHITSKW